MLAIASLLAALITVVLSAGPAEAEAFSELRYVVRVVDGDTFEVAPPGRTSGPVSVIRVIGISANEKSQCHGEAATTRLRNLIEGKWVRLSADQESSRATNGRWLRFVDYANIDIGELLIDDGYAMASPAPTEPSRNEKYLAATWRARQQGRRLWDPTACGAGPQQSLPLRVELRWDAVGGESSPNGEWATIYNDGNVPLSLTGWQFRDSAAPEIRTFPAGASIPPGGFYRVYPGPGTNTSDRWYLDVGHQLFDSAGDGAFLVDPDDDIRAYYMYPCSIDCTDPLQGKVKLTANYDAEGLDTANPNGEWVNIENISGSTIDLEGYEMRSGGQLYYFPGNSEIRPGERMRLYAGDGTNTRLAKYWGHADGALANAADSVELVTVDLRPIASFTWPCNPCGRVDELEIVGLNWDVTGPDLPNDEWIDIRNNGASAVDLRDWMLKDSSHFLDFDQSRTLAPGATLRIYIGSGTNTATTHYWGEPEPILGPNDIVQLESPHRDLIACYAQGTYTCRPVAEPAMCAGIPATIVGTAGADTIVGTLGVDVIAAGGGADVVLGLSGNDRICGGGGADTLYGGAGNDRLYGGKGRDILSGGPGNDVMNGNGNFDTVSYAAASGPVKVDLGLDTATGEGTDRIVRIENAIGSRFDDVLLGGGAANRLEGGDGDDEIRGRRGDDVLLGGDGNDTLFGGKRDDRLYGGFGSDIIEGRSGSDFAKGQNGSDFILGHSGDDILHGGYGPDTINGGTGVDTCTSAAQTACEQ